MSKLVDIINSYKETSIVEGKFIPSIEFLDELVIFLLDLDPGMSKKALSSDKEYQELCIDSDDDPSFYDCKLIRERWLYLMREQALKYLSTKKQYLKII